eukprot:PhM_4_TR2710/c0_g1_i1/m.37511
MLQFDNTAQPPRMSTAQSPPCCWIVKLLIWPSADCSVSAGCSSLDFRTIFSRGPTPLSVTSRRIVIGSRQTPGCTSMMSPLSANSTARARDVCLRWMNSTPVTPMFESMYSKSHSSKSWRQMCIVRLGPFDNKRDITELRFKYSSRLAAHDCSDVSPARRICAQCLSCRRRSIRRRYWSSSSPSWIQSLEMDAASSLSVPSRPHPSFSFEPTCSLIGSSAPSITPIVTVFAVAATTDFNSSSSCLICICLRDVVATCVYSSGNTSLSTSSRNTPSWCRTRRKEVPSSRLGSSPSPIGDVLGGVALTSSGIVPSNTRLVGRLLRNPEMRRGSRGFTMSVMAARF